MLIEANGTLAPWRMVEVVPEPGFRLKVRFVDNVAGHVDMHRLVHSRDAGVFAALADEARFAQVHIEQGAVCWPGDIDLAADAMHDAIERNGEWII